MSTASRIAAPRIATLATAIALAVILPWRAQAAPSLVYAPEAEAGFVDACIEDPAMTPAACRALMEGLQQRLGYAGFLEFVASPSDAAMIARSLSIAEPGRRRWASPRLVD